ncbi:MAG TPA: BadF/BadG/BcrA/BcrD ATPase family protein [Thermomicrobiales bacterium]|nr:BadF/BadG/BcrA/BcrD ATPase family protein [Thermomicrobiales bacterium]
MHSPVGPSTHHAGAAPPYPDHGPRPHAGYLVAVDGGQTSTKALLAAPDGTVLGRGAGGPCDRFDAPGGAARNRAGIQGAIRAAQAAAATAGHPAPEEVAAIGLGLTGYHAGGPELPAIEALVREALAPGQVVAVGDYVTNLGGASGGRPGVAVIAGGGSVAYGLAADGRDALVGGYGHLLGDEGSAYDIGRQALRAAMRAADGRDAPTALRDAVPAALGVAAPHKLLDVVYRPEFGRERVAALAPLVAEAARAGDATAARVMADAGEELAGLALACVRRLCAPGEAIRVYPTGGVFAAGAVLDGPFRDALRAGWPPARVESPAYPPVVGALILARRAAGGDADAAWLARVGATFELKVAS